MNSTKQIQILKIQNFGNKVSWSSFNKFVIPEEEILKRAPKSINTEKTYCVDEDLNFVLLFTKKLKSSDKVVSEFSY